MTQIEQTIIDQARQKLQEQLSYSESGEKDRELASFWMVAALTEIGAIQSGLSDEASRELREIEAESAGALTRPRKPAPSTENPTEYILYLIGTFPALRMKVMAMADAAPPPYLVRGEFDSKFFHSCMAGWSPAERLCGLFILNVWNPGEAKDNGWDMDWIEFLSRVSGDNRQAFLAWAAAPRWP